jgi:ribonuclease G
LRGIVREFVSRTVSRAGVIIRTAAAARPKDDIVSDLSYFHRVWTEIRQKSETSRAPAVVYQEQSLVAKLLRDLLTEEFSAIRIDNAIEHRRVLELIERIMPSLAPKVKLYEKEYPIFEEYGVQAEIDRALRSKVWLKSGGSIVINQTEALVAIDVNTGRYVGKKTAGRLEDTILKTNLEAVKEIVRQIRLRDLAASSCWTSSTWRRRRTGRRCSRPSSRSCGRTAPRRRRFRSRTSGWSSSRANA